MTPGRWRSDAHTRRASLPRLSRRALLPLRHSEPTPSRPEDVYTQVLVDEVHERTVEGDFLMLTLRRLLTQPRELPLHVCLMSATMDSKALAGYFGDCP